MLRSSAVFLHITFRRYSTDRLVTLLDRDLPSIPLRREIIVSGLFLLGLPLVLL